MALDLNRAEKPVRKLRKLLKKMSNPPTPEEVHDFRTNSRRVDATLKAFSLDSEPSSRRLLKRLARLRKRAGKVRDMDVLTDFASGLREKMNAPACCSSISEPDDKNMPPNFAPPFVSAARS